MTTWIICLLETYPAENAWQKIKRWYVLGQLIKYCFIVYIPFNIFTRTLKDSSIFHHYKYYSDEQIIKKKPPKIQFWKKLKKRLIDWLILQLLNKVLNTLYKNIHLKSNTWNNGWGLKVYYVSTKCIPSKQVLCK